MPFDGLAWRKHCAPKITHRVEIRTSRDGAFRFTSIDPFARVAKQIEATERVGLLRADRMRLLA